MCIYGIYAGQQLVYIGKTKRELRKRFLEHKRHTEQMLNGTYEGTQYDLYFALAEAKSRGEYISFDIFIDADKIVTEKPITDIDLQLMELALITHYTEMGYKLYNQEGITKPYKLR